MRRLPIATVGHNFSNAMRGQLIFPHELTNWHTGFIIGQNHLVPLISGL